MAKAGTHVALLRGINVGGKHQLPMKRLAAMFADAGCADVRTYIQSGNVVFTATAPAAARAAAAVTKAIREGFTYEIPIVLRTAEELAAVLAKNPFLSPKADPRTLHVSFLAEVPSRKRVAELDPKRSPPDAFAVSGRDVYLCFPNGSGRTKLSNDYLERTLQTCGTMRNWRTVTKLVELANA